MAVVEYERDRHPCVSPSGGSSCATTPPLVRRRTRPSRTLLSVLHRLWTREGRDRTRAAPPSPCP
ncbi:hypothetical protein ACFPM0_36855 [Pseudonocardia sulfidoxydans]|uniref:hypothetical protein n=1 Tax=Pseudonocardia sulfidoxydans TaxID=54011 RepID=UPI003606367A